MSVSAGGRRILLSLMEDDHIARAMRAAPTPTLRRYRDRFSPADFHKLIALGRDALVVLEEQGEAGERPAARPTRTPDARAENDAEAYAIRGRVELGGAPAQTVAGLTVEFWERNAAWTSARTSVVTDDVGKFEALIHVRDLATPSRQIYFRLLSNGSYLVPDPTKTWSPREGSAPVVLAISGTHVEGHVRHQDGTPLAGSTVSVFDSQIRAEVLLGVAITDADGFFGIDFAYSSPKLDVVVRAQTGSPTHGYVEVAHADLTTNIGQSVEIDLVVNNVPLAGLSEYGIVSNAIETSRGGVAATDLTADDVTAIANRYGLVPGIVQLAVDANVAVAQAGDPTLLPELFYAIGHTRKRVTVSSALAMSTDERSAAVNQAITANLVPSSFTTAVASTQLSALDGLRTNLALLDTGSSASSRLAVILALAGITNASSPKTNADVMSAYMTYTGALETFWASSSGLVDPQLTDVQNALALGIYTLNHPPMVASLWNDGIRTPAALAGQSEAQLVTRIGSSVTVPLPNGSTTGSITVGVPGEISSGLPADYAHAIATAISQAYPSSAVVAAYTASPLSGTTDSAGGKDLRTFFANNTSFDFASTSVPAFVRLHTTAFSGSSATINAQPLVERMARLFKLSPEANRYASIQALWNAGFDSARSIYLYGREPFIALMTSATYAWSTELATQVYSKAAHTNGLAVAIAMKYGASFQAPGAGGAIPQLGFDSSGAASPPTTIPDWANMFGSLDYCQCDECASVLGAAAYLTDLLHFLKQRPSGAIPTMLDTLKTRRPDITKIQLSCTNTNTILPTIDIINEALEERVHPTTHTSPYPEYQTTWSQDELAAHPEHLNAAAYDDLAGKIYPWSMPYSLYLDEGRTYVGMKSVTRAETRAVALGDPLGDGEWAKEILQMSELERQVIQGTGPLLVSFQPKDYWGIGISPPTPWYSSFAAAPAVLAASGLSYADAVSIIGSTFVTAAVSPAITVDLHGGCDTSAATLDNLDLTSGAASAPFFDRMHRFTRLWRRLGWTIRQTDRAIMNIGGGTLGSSLILSLAYAKELVRRTKMPVDTVLTWRAGTIIDTATDPVTGISPFEKLFPSKGAGTSVNIFALSSDRTALADETKSLADYYTALAAGLGSDVDSIEAIVAHESLGSANLALVNISTLFRYVTFAKALKLSVSSLLVLLSITGRMPFSSSHADHALRLVDDAADAKAYGLTPEKAQYLLAHVDSTPPKSTVVTCSVNLDAGTYFGATLDTSGNVTAAGQLVASVIGNPEVLFTNRDPITSSGGANTATFICTQTGAIACAAGTLTVIAAAVTGWNSITNPGDGVPGSDGVETPTAASIAAFLDGLRDGLGAVPTSAIDVGGEVTKTYLSSFYAHTNTPSDADIAYAIVAGTALADYGMDATAQNTFISTHGWSAFINVGDAETNLTGSGALTGADARFGYFQPFLQVFVDKQALVVGQIASAFGLTNDVADAVLRTYVHARTASGTADTGNALDLLTALGSVTGSLALSADWYTYLHIQKVGTILSRLKFTSADLPWVFDATNAPLALDSLPVIETTSATFASLARLVHAASLRAAFAGGALFDIFEDVATSSAKYPDRNSVLSEISRRTAWLFDDLKAIADNSLPSALALADFKNEQAVIRLSAAIGVIQRLGLAASTVFPSWVAVTYPTDGTDAQALKDAVRGTFAADAWLGVAKPARNGLRGRQRDVLADYLVHAVPFTDIDALSADVLLDVAQQSCAQTSRIVQALASTQTFLERILLNLESGFSLSTDDARQWKWMKQYRIWQANREIFLYPENWIEPSLRDDKTPLFQDFETNVAKGDLTDDTIEDALVQYLHGLDEVANLSVAAAVNDVDPDTGKKTFHVVARTRANPPVYYYRTREDEARWTAWQKIDADIHSDHMLVAIYNRRVFLLALNVTESSKTKDQAQSTSAATNAPVKQFQVWLKWTSLRAGKWSKVQQSITWVPDEKLTPLTDAEEQFDVSDTNTDQTSQPTAAEKMRRAFESLAFRVSVDSATNDLRVMVINSRRVPILNVTS